MERHQTRRRGLVAALLALAVLVGLLRTPLAAAQAPAWDGNYRAYTVGALVSYAGSEYRCIQAHTSQPGWTPPVVPALWTPTGGTSPTSTRTATARPTNTPTRTATAGPTRTPTRTATAGPTRTPTRVPSATPTRGPGVALPRHILVGYWHNFDNGSGFIRLRDVSPRWDVINVSFAEPTGSAPGTIGFTPYNASAADFRADVAYLQSLGKKVIISIGGANGQVQLTSAAARDNFVNSMATIISTYGFDGLDVDFEGHSLYLNEGDRDIANPTTPVLVHTIAALRALKGRFGAGFMLTMAPETFFVQLGYSFYGGTCLGCDRRAGAYLPVIYALRNDLNWLQVQNYNSGPISGLDGAYHSMGGADFHIAMLDMLVTGFPVAGTGQSFPALRADQVVLGLPATTNAGNGFVAHAEVQRALDYVARGVPYGSYVMRTTPNRDLRGVMTWSVNWDAFAGFQFSSSYRAYLDALP